MSVKLSIRTDASLREALLERAEEQGKSLSRLVREILEEALAVRPMADRIGHLKGRLQLPGRRCEAWRERLRDRNWRS